MIFWSMKKQPGCSETNVDLSLSLVLTVLQLFSMDGVFLQRIGQRGRKPGQILRPTGIAFLPKCQNRWEQDVLVVADYENRTVVLFSVEAGESLTSFGSARLTGPKGVAVAANGDIIVVRNSLIGAF